MGRLALRPGFPVLQMELVPEVHIHLDPFLSWIIRGLGFAGIQVVSRLVQYVGVRLRACRNPGEELTKLDFKESLCLIKCDECIHVGMDVVD